MAMEVLAENSFSVDNLRDWEREHMEVQVCAWQVVFDKVMISNIWSPGDVRIEIVRSCGVGSRNTA